MQATGWLGRAALAVLLLHVGVLVYPALLFDDYEILVRSWTWDETRDGLWVPQNEHTMPLGRLTNWVLIQLAADPRVLAYLCDLQGIVGVLLALPLVYLFVSREVESRPLGVVAAMLFAVSSIYQQAVVWFAASFSILALDMLLLGLLAAQAWRQTGRGLYLDLCLLACLLAPGWFASGILAGPICFLYLLVPATTPGRRWHPVSIAPLVGSALFLAIALPRVAATILHLPHYQGRNAVESFQVGVGALYTARSLVDNLLLGQFGITGVCVPLWLVVPVLVLALAALVYWLWPVRDFRLVIVGLGLILLPYLLTYSARATWDYVESGMSALLWNRYHLLPQLGLAFVIAAGLAPRLATGNSSGFTPGWNRGLAWLLVVLFLLHWPRGLMGVNKAWDLEHPERSQWPAFARIAEVDARLREAGVSRAAALEALPPWVNFPGAGEHFNAWELLHGSPTPRDVPPEEIRRLLE